MDLDEIWRLREEEIYPRLFGTQSRGIFTLSQALFRERFGQVDVGLRWLFLGVFEFAATADRSCWVYVTSGLSNPWENGQDASAVHDSSANDVQLLLATTECAEWAIVTLLNLLAFDVLLSADRYPGKPSLTPGDRIPLRAPINENEACLIRNVPITRADNIWPAFTLPSGPRAFPRTDRGNRRGGRPRQSHEHELSGRGLAGQRLLSCDGYKPPFSVMRATSYRGV
jgi:hypothetical protein